MLGAVGKLFSNAKALYKGINSATLTGAIDVVAVEQEDGTYLATPFHVRFGKLGVIRSKEKVVYIEINGEPCDLCMKLGDDGEAFFVEDTDEQPPRHLATSPIPSDVECGATSAVAEEAAAPASLAATGKWQPMELSRVLSDSALFVPGLREQRRERHESEGARLGGGQLLIPPSSTSAAYFEPIGAPAKSYMLENESFAGKGGSDRAADGVPSDRFLHTAELPTEWSGAQQYAFSDPEVTPVMSPIPSRPTSPKSDTELETAVAAASAAIAASVSDSGLQQWNWGELPRKNSLSSRSSAANRSTAAEAELPGSSSSSSGGGGKEELKQPKGAAAEENSASTSATTGGGLLSFIRKPKSSSKMPEDQGIYLEDLKLDEMDPEVAALYFPKRGPLDPQKEHYSTTQPVGKDDDVESGSGPSLPHSPPTVMDLRYEATASSAGSETDTSTTDHMPHVPFGMFGDIAMSLCGGLKDPDSSIALDKFMHHFVTFEDFCKDPNVFANPNLVIRMHGKFFNWKVAAPMVMSLAAFTMPLPDETVGMLTKQHMPKEERRRGMFAWWGSKPKAETAKEPATKSEGGGKASTKPSGSEAAAAGGASATAASTAAEQKADALPNAAGSAATSKAASDPKNPEASLTAGIGAAVLTIDSGDEADDETTAADYQCNGHIAVSTTSSNRATTGTAVAGRDAPAAGHVKELDDQEQQPCYKKTLRLSSDQLKQLKLREGSNDIEYSVTTALQGTTRCVSHVYVWKWTDRIVVSDIDGTITRSDVLGQLLPMVGKDWSQGGVVQLYNRIAANGYKFVYLSARAIGQAQITRDYLRSVRQQQASLPPGPMLLSPTSLVQAFQKEVIERKPEEFKISCLRDIKSLFSSRLESPLYAGFGNKINDVWAYRAVDIPMSRIFTINPKGELRHELSQTFVSSYTQLSDVADHFFPPVQLSPSQDGGQLSEFSDYSSFAFWRDPLPPVLLDLAAN